MAEAEVLVDAMLGEVQLVREVGGERSRLGRRGEHVLDRLRVQVALSERGRVAIVEQLSSALQPDVDAAGAAFDAIARSACHS